MSDLLLLLKEEGASGPAPVTPIDPDTLLGTKSVAVKAGSGISKSGINVAYWYDYYKGGSNPGFDSYSGTLAPPLVTQTRETPNFSSNFHFVSTDWNIIDFDKGTIFVAFIPQAASVGLFSWYKASDDYFRAYTDASNVLHLAGGDDAAHTFTLDGPTLTPGEIYVAAFQFDNANKTMAMYTSGSKVEETLTNWDTNNRWLNIGTSMKLAVTTGTTDTNCDILDWFCFESYYDEATVNGVLAYFSERWGLTWSSTL